MRSVNELVVAVGAGFSRVAGLYDLRHANEALAELADRLDAEKRAAEEHARKQAEEETRQRQERERQAAEQAAKDAQRRQAMKDRIDEEMVRYLWRLRPMPAGDTEGEPAPAIVAPVRQPQRKPSQLTFSGGSSTSSPSGMPRGAASNAPPTPARAR